LAVKEKGRGALVNYERAVWVYDRRPGSRAKFDGPYRFRKGVDHILCPFNRHGNHWSLLIINGPSHTIVHVDSMWSDGSIMLRIMLFFLGQMAANCIESNCTDTPDWLLHFNAEEWSLYDLGDKLIPQQGNGNDCGVFVCMFMTIYMFMKPPYSILSEDSVTPFKRSVEGFRRKMIRLFFDSSIDADTFEEFLDNC
jgi:Ulp1 family protease